MRRIRYQGIIGDRPVDIPIAVNEAAGVEERVVPPAFMDRVAAYLRCDQPEVYRLRPSDIPTHTKGAR
jgi:hypothetical protein